MVGSICCSEVAPIIWNLLSMLSVHNVFSSGPVDRPKGEGVGKAASAVSGWKVELGFDISSIKLIVV